MDAPPSAPPSKKKNHLQFSTANGSFFFYCTPCDWSASNLGFLRKNEKNWPLSWWLVNAVSFCAVHGANLPVSLSNAVRKLCGVMAPALPAALSCRFPRGYGYRLCRASGSKLNGAVNAGSMSLLLPPHSNWRYTPPQPRELVWQVLCRGACSKLTHQRFELNFRGVIPVHWRAALCQGQRAGRNRSPPAQDGNVIQMPVLVSE